MKAEWIVIKIIFCIVLSFLTFHLILLFLINGFGGKWPGIISSSIIVGFPAFFTLFTISYWKKIMLPMEVTKIVFINLVIFYVASFSVWHISTGNEGFRNEQGILD